jgi:UDP-N-acetylglucosamine acyltransferase
MVTIHPSAVVHKSAQLAPDVIVGPHCVVGDAVSIDSGSILDANVVIDGSVKIGKNNHFFPGCVIGCKPQVLALSPNTKIGGVIIGDGNAFRECVTIHPSMSPERFTKIGNDNFVMVGAHVGHDCLLEDKIVMSNCVLIAGHCKIESGVWISGLVGVHQFVTMGRWVYAAGLAGINRDIPPFLIVSGHYPQRIRGVNKRGLQRAGLTGEQQQRIQEAYKRLYRQGGALLENAKLLAQEDGLDENVRAMVEAIIKSSEHQFGRYLETFRKH